MDLKIGRNSGKFNVRADSLRKLHSYLSLYLKRLKYTIEDSEVDESRMVIRAARGSKLFHAMLEFAESYSPVPDIFDWALRVQILIRVYPAPDGDGYLLFLSCEPACNDVLPMQDFLTGNFDEDEDEQHDSSKLKKAFEEFATVILGSAYYAR